MNYLNILIITAFILALFLFVNTVIDYTSRRDREEQPSLYIKLWLVPVLSLIIIVPITGFAFLYGLFFYSFEQITEFIQFNNYGDIFTFSLVLMLGVLLFDTLIHPIVINVIRYLLQKEISIYSKHAVTIIVDSIIIYFLSGIFGGVYIENFLSALSISVVYHVIEWILTGLYLIYKKGNRTKG